MHLTRWETAYSAADGVATRAVVRIENGSGSYEVYCNGNLDGRGEFSNIVVSTAVKYTIEGHWKFGGREGFLQWNFSPLQPDRFSGTWTTTFKRAQLENGRES